jgi:hypothetical protein
MTLVKIDHPRRIDPFIDYFGEPRRPASSASSPAGSTAIDPREPRPCDAAHGWPIAPAFRSPVDAA